VQEFLPFSFGFRPGRSQHQALEYLREQCFAQKVQWVLEVDLRKFFDTVDHRQMQEFLSRRVQDGGMNRLIGKWLKAGVWEKEEVSYPEEGTPQGGVICFAPPPGAHPCGAAGGWLSRSAVFTTAQ
jgi:RNA-directed DNA polymerase